MKASHTALALLAFAVSAVAALVVAGAIMGYLIEREEARWTEPACRPGPEDPLSPREVSALLEEARRIAREAAGDNP